MKKFNFWSLLLLVPFAAGLFVALTEAIPEIERAVFDFMRNLAPAMDIPFRAITELGSAVGVICVTVIIFFASIFKKRFFDFGLPVTIVVIVSRIINITLKNVFDRPRPEFRVLEASESSFPSGHSQNNMALYLALLIVCLLIVKAPKWRTFFKIAFISLPIIIGLTRVYFGVHYISDVVAGWSMGALVAIVTLYFYFLIYQTVKEKHHAQN